MVGVAVAVVVAVGVGLICNDMAIGTRNEDSLPKKPTEMEHPITRKCKNCSAPMKKRNRTYCSEVCRLTDQKKYNLHSWKEIKKRSVQLVAAKNVETKSYHDQKVMEARGGHLPHIVRKSAASRI